MEIIRMQSCVPQRKTEEAWGAGVPIASDAAKLTQWLLGRERAV